MIQKACSPMPDLQEDTPEGLQPEISLEMPVSQSMQPEAILEPLVDSKAIIDGFYACSWADFKKLVKADSPDQAVDYFRTVVRCLATDPVDCQPATFLPMDCDCIGILAEGDLLVEANWKKLA